MQHWFHSYAPSNAQRIEELLKELKMWFPKAWKNVYVIRVLECRLNSKIHSCPVDGKYQAVKKAYFYVKNTFYFHSINAASLFADAVSYSVYGNTSSTTRGLYSIKKWHENIGETNTLE